MIPKIKNLFTGLGTIFSDGQITVAVALAQEYTKDHVKAALEAAAAIANPIERNAILKCYPESKIQ